MNFKKGCGTGCLVLFSISIIFMGAATWYAARINKEYKAVQKTEKVLLAATAEPVFMPAADLVVDAARLDAFLSVRDSLQSQRQDLEAAALEFAREKDKNQDGGLKGFLSLLSSGSELAPIYATYWSHRNAALLAHKMSPDEYIWYYNFTYYIWLEKAPTDGRDANTSTLPVTIDILGIIPQSTEALLAPRRLALESTYSPQLNPIELIFSTNSSPNE